MNSRKKILNGHLVTLICFIWPSFIFEVYASLKKFFIGGQEIGEIIPFPVWMIPFPVFKTSFKLVDKI